MGILLVANILDEHRSLTNLFGKGNSLIWGGLGWCALFLGIILVGYHPVKYIRKYLEVKHIKAVCASEKEKNRVMLEGIRMDEEKNNSAYEREKRELEKEQERKQEMKSKLRNKLKINSVKDIKFFLKNRKKLEKEIWELEKDIEGLKEKKSELEEAMEAENEEFLSNCEELQKKVEECEEQIEEGECELEDSKKIFLSKMKKRKAIFIIILFLLLTDGKNMLVTAQELKNTLTESFDSAEELQVNEPETEEPVTEDVTLINKEENIETSLGMENNLREHMNYNFILEDEQLNKAMDDKIADIISLEGYSKDLIGYEQFLTDCSEGNMIEILPIVDYDTTLSLNELLNKIAVDLEKPFLEKIKEGQEIRTQIEWEQLVPKSMELENIINKRRQVLGMEESSSIRRTIYFQLANDYQRLGNECLIQGEDGSQIYYYYGMSIYCCYCALGYDESGENSKSDEYILNYVKARYRDIMNNEKMGIPVEKVNNAQTIYSLLDK